MTTEAGRRQRFEVLAEVVFDPLQRYLLRRAHPEDAEDALGETLLTIWRRLDDVPSDNPLPWCYGVARLTLSNQRRAGARRARMEEKVLGLRLVPDDPDESFLHDDLSAALLSLPEAYRDVLTLWAWEGLEPREIAEVMNTTANTISLRLNRAKAKLKKELGRQSDANTGQKLGEREEQAT